MITTTGISDHDVDYYLMLELTRQRDEWTYTTETRDNCWYLPAAYNKAYYQGRQ